MSSVRDSFDSLCAELNMDPVSKSKAWEDYESIKENYSLEGNQLHWLACSLYVACRHHSRPPLEGNGVSLTRLLRSSSLSLVQFLSKAKKWADMFNLKKELRDKIERLERNFAVSSVIFKKYEPIFLQLFKAPVAKAAKKSSLSPVDVFDFTWGLFVRVKADFPAISDDLVNSYHLLLSCVDHVYDSATKSHPGLLRNPKKSAQEQEDVLESLCRTHEGILPEVKSIREHYWKPHIGQFMRKKSLRGDPETLSGILDPAHFDFNAKSMRKEYEAYVLSIGEYDERVFLGDNAASTEAGTPTKASHSDAGEPGEKVLLARRNLARQFDGNALIPNTPLSGKHYLKAKDQMKVTPVSTATYLVSRLNNLIGKREAEPSPKLLEFFKTCESGNPGEAISERVQKLGDIFSRSFTGRSESHQGSFARMRLKMGIILYYKLLERILLSEKEKGKSIGNLLDQNQFHSALFACCLEVVIFSYNSQRTFPWILDTFALESIQFYKVIEIIIRNEDALPRDVVKHLQRIEEQILELRAWVRESALWEEIEKDGRGVPSCEEVALPNNEGTSSLIVDPLRSPLSNQKQVFAVIKSPMAGDRFKSPVVNAVARRQLFLGAAPSSPGNSIVLESSQRSDSVKKILLASPKVVKQQQAERPKRTGSLGLFFRKVYHLSYLRLEQLCFSLQITDDEIKRKIWTTFEFTLKQNTDLMKDRHLDQLLMCSLYIVCKVVGSTKNFTDIMKHYRTQPQAASHVYRSVLLRPKGIKKENVDGESSPSTNGTKSTITPPTPTRLAASSTISEDGEERGDLIKFYNTVFMERLQEFSLKFKRSRQSEAPPLSPLPKLRSHPQSPCKKVSENQRIFIRPLKTSANEVVMNSSPHKPLQYNFNRSPAKNLNAINELMREAEKKSTRGKRLLVEEDEGSSSKSRKMDEILMLPSSSTSLEQQSIKAEAISLGSGGGTGSSSGGGGVNNKLEIILGDRSQM